MIKQFMPVQFDKPGESASKNKGQIVRSRSVYCLFLQFNIILCVELCVGVVYSVLCCVVLSVVLSRLVC